jgi:hypothetical protein
VYDKQEVSFGMVVKMFRELCVGNSSKIDVMWIAEPEGTGLCGSFVKKIFTIESLRHDFPAGYAEFEELVLNKVYDIIGEMEGEEVEALGRYLKDISKIQFKKVVNWSSMLELLSKSRSEEAEHK